MLSRKIAGRHEEVLIHANCGRIRDTVDRDVELIAEKAKKMEDKDCHFDSRFNVRRLRTELRESFQAVVNTV